ncbi:MAG TPA: outer membrane protein assembly factor BamE [Macromonas sp.]|nr:outer membrane protein assembly factor BamE [Macromonas sp.]
MTNFTLSRIHRAGALALVLTALGGCTSMQEATTSMSTLGGLITPYKMDIVQGNVVTREQVEALQPGMPREQVRNILGTPLLTSVFHGDRWDYVFTFRRQGQEPQHRKVVVFFKGDAVERVEADKLPSEVEFVASLDVRTKPGEMPVLEASEASLKAFEVENAKEAKVLSTPAQEEPAPATSYPPLESR